MIVVVKVVVVVVEIVVLKVVVVLVVVVVLKVVVVLVVKSNSKRENITVVAGEKT